MVQTHCRYFTGYKPCGLNDQCHPSCPQKSIVTSRILIVHLEALGAVLRATTILPAIHRKYPGAHVTWVTQKPAHELLKHNPLVDRVLTTSLDDILSLSALSFDIGYCIDKSLKASGVFSRVRVGQRFGFMVEDSSGVIQPLTPAADELWQLGLNDEKKFFQNKKPETQLIIEALELGPFCRDSYVISLTKEERQLADQRRRLWANPDQMIVGINTGCSDVIAYKKLSVENHRQMIGRLKTTFPKVQLVLLGGPEDTSRNQNIAHGLDVVSSPTTAGLRDGLCSVQACDMVITGDSLGMHMAIGLDKWVIAWFGPTCAHEIDLYGRGTKVIADVPCTPCWKRHCDRSPMCYDRVDFEKVIDGVNKGIQWATLLSKQPLSEISYSASL